MSKENPQEHIKTYETFCAPRFNSMESNLKDTTKAVNDLNAIVTNGLEDKVEHLEKQSRWILRLLVSLLLLIIGCTITLYTTNDGKASEIHNELMERINEISN